MKVINVSVFLFLVILSYGCQSFQSSNERETMVASSEVIREEVTEVIVGADRLAMFVPMLQHKKVACVVNQTSMTRGSHLVDTLLKLEVELVKVFAPEHGFRGKADAGQEIDDGIDGKTGLPIVSLYGEKKKPSSADLAGIEAIVFDIQDVGARFYTYISSLHYVMEAAAEHNIPVIVLDRPNPNAHYVDGPILEPKYKSFIGMHPVPVVYGMTIGEYAQMINGEEWLDGGLKADLTVIPLKNYDHNTFYELPIKPSPNLPNIRSILLYPSLCFIEGSYASLGRGTETQFQVIGHPALDTESFSFTPVSREGAKYPKFENKKCYGVDLSSETIGSLREMDQLDLSYLLDFYKKVKATGEPFFLDNNFFEKLAGTEELRKQVIAGMSETEIRETWQQGLEEFKGVRSKYLLY